MVTLKINELRCRVEKDDEGSNIFMYHEMCMRILRHVQQTPEEHFISVRYSTIIKRLNERRQCIQEIQETVDYKTYPIYALKLTQEKHNTDLALELIKDLNCKIHQYTLSYTVGFRIPTPKWIHSKYETFVEIVDKFRPKLKFEKQDCLEKHIPTCPDCEKHFCNITCTLEEFGDNTQSDNLDKDSKTIKLSKSHDSPEEVVESSNLYFFEY